MPSLSIQLPQVNADYRSPVISGSGAARTSNAEQIRALEELKTAGSGVRIPVPDYAAGTNALGQGLMDVGKNAMSIMQRRQELQSLDKQMTIEAKSAVMQAELDAELKGIQDPSLWEEHAAKKIDTFVSSIDTTGMDERAAMHVKEIFVPTLQGKLMAAVKGKATIEQENKTRQTGFNLLNLAKEAKDPVLTAQSINTLWKSGLINDDEYKLYLLNSGREISKRALNDLMQKLKTDQENGDSGTAKERLASDEDAKKLMPEDRYHAETFVKDMDKMQTLANEASVNPYGVIMEANKALAGQKSDMFDKFKLQPYQIDQARKNAETQLGYLDQQAFEEGINMLATSPSALKVALENPDEARFAWLSPGRKALLTDKLNNIKKEPDGREFIAFASAIEEMPRAVNASPEDRLFITQWQADVKARFSPEQSSMLLQMQDEHWKGSGAEVGSDAIKKLSKAFKDGYLGNYKVPYVENYNPGYFAKKFGAEPIEGTPLSPADQARTQLPAKIDGRVNEAKLLPGEPVVDQRLYQQAAQAFDRAKQQAVQMRKEGKTEKEINDFIDSIIKTVPLKKAAITNPATLFPSLDQRQDVSKELLQLIGGQ